MKKEINRMRAIFEIIRILAGESLYIDVNEIKIKLDNNLDTILNPRTVKQYLIDIQKYFDWPLESRLGHGGGYKLRDDTRKLFAEISQLQLNSEEKNALNDAFEIAEKSASFYYYDDHQKARAKLYLKFNMKENDSEYYVGQEQHVLKITKRIKEVKRAIIERLLVNISFKYELFGSSKEILTYKPLSIIHDVDETFLVLKIKGIDKLIFQNIRNVKTLEVTNIKFERPKDYDVHKHINKHTIKVKGEHRLSFEIIDEEGNEIYDVWNYDFDDETKIIDSKIKTIIFYEQYCVFEFLLRMQPHIKDLEMSEELKSKWNKIVTQLSVIK